MGELTITDYEKEFLELMGITFDENGKMKDKDYDSPFELRAYKMEKEHGEDQELFRYSNGFKRIEFHRIKGGLYPFMATVSVNYGGYKHWAREDYFKDENLIRERTVGIFTDGKDLNDRTPVDYSSFISFKQTDSSDYISNTRLEDESNRLFHQSYDIVCSLSTIYSGAEHKHEYTPVEIDDVLYSKKAYDLSVTNYINALIEAIKTNFKSRPEAQDFYLKAVPYLFRAFESSLTIPFKYKDYYVKRLEVREERILKQYPVSAQAAKLEELAKMREFLDTFYKEQPINQKGMELTRKTSED